MFDKNKVKLGIAPIAWTNDDLPDLGAENTFEQCVSEMALAGFTGSEVGNKYPKDPAELPAAIAASKKAFIVTRFADLGFLIGILVYGYYAGTYTFSPNEMALAKADPCEAVQPES